MIKYKIKKQTDSKPPKLPGLNGIYADWTKEKNPFHINNMVDAEKYSEKNNLKIYKVYGYIPPEIILDFQPLQLFSQESDLKGVLITDATEKEAKEWLKKYTFWLNGEVYEVEVYKEKKCHTCNSLEKIILGRIYNIYGRNLAEKKAKEFTQNIKS